MSGSPALRKILFADNEGDFIGTRGYHFNGSHAPLLSPIVMQQPAAVTPRSGFRFACACFGTSLIACVTMKTRNNGKMWMCTFLMTAAYYSSVKAHKVDNGVVGHQAGTLAAAIGVIGCLGHVLGGGGGRLRKANAKPLAIFLPLLWYEIGRYHIWSEYLTEFSREVCTERYYNLLTEYVPPEVETVFLPYRDVASQ